MQLLSVDRPPNLSDRVPVTETGDELQRLAETCNAMLARLESAVNQIRQFTADASHELRGPLTFEDIVEEAAKAASLLEDMLALARADADHGDAVLEPMSLSAVVEEVCEMARPIAAERSLALNVDVAEDHTVKVLGDSPTLRRLLCILLDNAFKYTPAPGDIDIVLRATREGVTVQVRGVISTVSKGSVFQVTFPRL